MSKTTRLMPGAKVQHDFSRNRGVVIDVRKDLQGYDYKVRWDYPDRIDWAEGWYQRDVLEEL